MDIRPGTFAISVLFGLLLFSCNKSENTTPAKNGTSTGNTSGTTSGITTGISTSTTTTCNAQISDIENMSIFPADNSWNQDISASAVDPYSSQIIALIGTSHLKADFGSGLWDNAPVGIPFVVVCGSQPKIKVTFRANAYDGNYGSESDAGPYPIPSNAPIEGNGQGDSHVLVVDKDNKMLYELYNASVSGGKWSASSGAIYNLASDQFRPAGWTSADAAGLPIFPGLVKYDEIVKGAINHPIQFTLSSSNVKPAYIAPARHSVNSSGGPYSLPFGAKIRLKASFDISVYPAHIQIILKAMKKYGLILADIGSNMYISGAPDSRWNNDELQKLGSIAASNFEVVKFN
ncbi:MAG: hypothetical protein JWP37_397 [Mucilaginibacter sp.]|nr:hypothetical protein [Mucilaginibacter sp.]